MGQCFGSPRLESRSELFRLRPLSPRWVYGVRTCAPARNGAERQGTDETRRRAARNGGASRRPAESRSRVQPSAVRQDGEGAHPYSAEVRSCSQIVGNVLVQNATKASSGQHDDVIEALAPNGSDESLRVGVGVSRRLHRPRVVRHKPFASPIPSIRCMGVSSDGSTAGRRGVRIASTSTTMPGS